ncbi:T9SS type A sorting domain-containing protein [Xanthomarina gelatinilytica]|uniref:T9SS type A sorting domain-containing protein n=1 Tax=Xanthomarina gelatinilytica TaxID=1137281 RepID=UPI003AA868C1
MIKQLYILCILLMANAYVLNAQTFPFVREWGTYYGNNANMKDAVVDDFGNIYIASSIDIESIGAENYATPNAHQAIPGGGISDVLLTKFSPEGAVLWSTYYGGEMDESPTFLTLDENNNVYVAGETNSSIGIATENAYQTVKITTTNETEVNTAGFLAKFSSDGTLLYGTYYDGEKDDSIKAINVKNNTIYIIGETASTTNITTTGSYQPNFTGIDPQQRYTFIVKFNGQFQRIWGTYYGIDNGFASSGVFCLDNDENIYISGSVSQFGDDNNYYASSDNVYQLQNHGNIDLYITKFDTYGNRVWSTYFGDNKLDAAMDIIYHDNHIFLSGYSYSRNISIGNNVHQTERKGSFDDFLLKMDINGQPVWATYFGGVNNTTDSAKTTKLSKDLNGSVWMAGLTTDETDIATSGSYQTILNNGSNTLTSDSYFAKFNANGTLAFASYYGGEDTEREASKVLSLPNGSGFYITGTTKSTTAIATESAIQSTLYGETTLFLGKFILENLNVNTYLSNTLKLYPNPTQKQITIKSNKRKILKLTIYNTQGKLVHEVNTVYTNQLINLPKLSAGHYFLIATVIDTLEKQTFKLLINN